MQVQCVSNLLLSSPLAATDGPADWPATGLATMGDEGLSSSGPSLVTSSTVSASWASISGGRKRDKKNKGFENMPPQCSSEQIGEHPLSFFGWFVDGLKCLCGAAEA
jgi:hypothetical protein